MPNIRYATPRANKTGNVVRIGRRYAGQGQRSAAPTPFLHRHPANKDALENTGMKPAEAAMGVVLGNTEARD